jgi:LysM repeat protein
MAEVISALEDLSMKGILSILLYGGLVATAVAQQKPDVVAYIEKYKDIAIEEMVRTKIPASITLAQGILESGCGKSELSVKTNNHFGIKCKEEWSGGTFHYDDDAPGECFRVYTNVRESYADHSDFLVNRTRYAELFKLPVTDYKAWAAGLKAAGYATNPKYAEILIKNIEEYELHTLDRVGYAIIKNNEKNPLPVQATLKESQQKQSVEQTYISRDEFLVNGIRAIKAKENEEPFAIAFEYNLDYAHVLAFNDLSAGERFKGGENVFLQPKKSKGEGATYTVQKGESMRDISQRLGIKVKDLYYKNLMKPNEQPVAGTELNLYSKRTTPPSTMSYAEYLKTISASPGRTVEKTAVKQMENSGYQVQQKDTLYSIAKKFNTSVERIRELNSIEADSIRVGQTLVVSE